MGLARLRDEHVFDPVPLRSRPQAWHVPFDEVTGRPDTEARVGQALAAMERIAVSGRSGVGKTSRVLEATTTPSGADAIDAAARLVDAVAAHGLQPVLVVDDSDARLPTPAGDRTALVAPFFDRVLRMVAEELNAALVVAVHDHYFDVPGFDVASGFVEQRVAVPPLPSPESLGRIVAERAVGPGEVDPSDVVLPAAVEALFAYYEQCEGNIRRPLTLAHLALHAACEDGAEAVGRAHVEVALTQV